MAAVVVFSKSVERMAAFYESVLGACVLEREKRHVVLVAAGVEVVVHGIPAGIARSIDIANPPEARSTAAMKPAFDVDDLDRVRKAASAMGGRLYPAEKGFEIRGRRVIDGLDPEGNVVQFREAL